MKISELEASGQPVCVGHGVLSRKPRTPCYGRFYLQASVMERAECQNTAGTPQQHGSRGCCSVMQKVWSHTR